MAKTFRIVVNGRPYTVEVGGLSGSSVSVVVNGRTHKVELEQEAPPGYSATQPRPAPAPVLPRPAPAAQPVVPGAVVAPMPGKILAVQARVGHRVRAGDELLVLEAMKMEQSIRATAEGVVKSVEVEAGQSVARGQLLITLGQEEQQG